MDDSKKAQQQQEAKEENRSVYSSLLRINDYGHLPDRVLELFLF